MLSGTQIVKEIKNGMIKIDPFNKNHISPNSYDLTLGQWVIRFKNRNDRYNWAPIYLDKADVDYVFEKPVQHASHISIDPKERILAHTKEIAGAYGKFVPMIASRSSLVRWGLDVCVSAGFGDVGYVNKWTLEIFNFSNNKIYIPIGARICQIYFEPLDSDDGFYEKYDGYYKQKTSWLPSDMYPQQIKSELYG